MYSSVISQLLLIQYIINLSSEHHQAEHTVSHVVHTVKKGATVRSRMMNKNISGTNILQQYDVVYPHITHKHDIYPAAEVQAGYITFYTPDLISSFHI